MKRTFLFVLLMMIIMVFPQTFKDVEKSHWAYGSVIKLTEMGLFKGIVKSGELTFQGSKSLTRYEFAVAMDRLLFNILNISQDITKTVDLSDETFKLQSSLITEMKTMMANLQVEVNMNRNSINKTIEKVKELEDKLNASNIGRDKTVYYLAIGAFTVSVISLVLALSK